MTYPYVIISAGLGKNQMTDFIRMGNNAKGYTKGQPDLELKCKLGNNLTDVVAIELNNPSNKTRPEQDTYLERLRGAKSPRWRATTTTSSSSSCTSTTRTSRRRTPCSWRSKTNRHESTFRATSTLPTGATSDRARRTSPNSAGAEAWAPMRCGCSGTSR